MRASGVRKYIDFRAKYDIRIYDNYSLERIVTTEYKDLIDSVNSDVYCYLE